MDEAKRKKISIDLNHLSELLGVPVVGTTARDGKGLEKLKDIIAKVALGKVRTTPKKIQYDEIIEKAITEIEPYIQNSINDQLNSKWTALRLIDSDNLLLESINNYLDFDLSKDELLNLTLKRLI